MDLFLIASFFFFGARRTFETVYETRDIVSDKYHVP